MSGSIAEEIAFVAGLSVKAAAVFALGALLLLCLRRSSASLRHRAGSWVIWSAAALPLAAMVLPGFELPVLPARAAALRTLAPAVDAALTPAEDSEPKERSERLDALDALHAPAQRAPRRASLVFSSSDGAMQVVLPAAAPALAAHPGLTGAAAAPSSRWHLLAQLRSAFEALMRPLNLACLLALAAGMVWLLGAILLWARLASGLRRVFRYGREGVPAEPAAQSMLARSAHKLGLRRAHPVRLLLHPEVSVAMTAGARKPVVLLPASSREWSAERMQVVLLHELAHVQRGDWQTLIASEIALAVWWFHPLAWWLSRAVRRDAEQAADDLVLAAGTRPSDYAAHLLAIVRGLREGEQAPRPAMAMAQLAGIEERVRAILDGRRRRGAGVMQGRVLACALGAAMLVLAVARPTAARARDESVPQLAPLPPLPPPVPDTAPAMPRPPRAPRVSPAPKAPLAPQAPLAPLPPLAPVAPKARPALSLPPRAPLAPLPPVELGELDLSGLEQLSRADLPGRVQPKSLRIAIADRDADVDDARAERAEQQAARLQQEAERVQQRAEQEAERAQERAEQDAARGQAEAERAQQEAERFQRDAERVQADARRRAEEMQRIALAGSEREHEVDIHLDGNLLSQKISKHVRAAMDKLGTRLAGLDERMRGGRDGDDEDDYYERGMRLHQRGRYKEAIEVFQKAIDHDQRADDASYNIACGYAQLGDVEKTAEWLKRAADEGFDVEGSVGSDDDFDPVRQDPKFRAVLQELRSQRGSRHAAEARALERRYQRLVQRNPKSADSWYSLGKELLEAGSYDFAAKSFQASAERSQRPGNSLYNEACALALKGDKAAALDQLQKAIEQGFDDVHQLRRDDDLDAIHDEARFKDLVQLARDLELDIDRGSFELNIGSVHLWSRKNNKKHQADDLAHYQEMAKKHDGLGRAHYNLGYAQLNGDDPAGAEASFRKALALGYRKGTTLYNIACAQARQGHKDAAFDSLKASADAGFDVADSIGGDDDLESLRGDARYRQLKRDARERDDDDDDE